MMGEGPSLRNVARLDAGALPMTHAMQMRGLQVDLDHFAKMDEVLTQDMERVTSEVSEIAGHYVNPGSGDQVSHLLFKEMGLKQARPTMTPGGTRESVEHEVLVAIQHEHPVVAKILAYKEYDKLRGTYARPLLKLAKKVDNRWRVFPDLKTTRVPSGRYSCAEPNLLAMPNRTPRGRELLKGFITDPGWTFLSCDASQIEPRIVAHRSEDPNLIRVYENQEDIYSDFAISAFALKDERYRDAEGWHYPSVDKKLHRFPSKTCILASIYRVTGVGLLQQMPALCRNCHVESKDHQEQDCPLGFVSQWTEDNCTDLINQFYLKYSHISGMQRMDDARARKFGFIWDDVGRLMHTTAVRSVHPWVVAAALRESGNMPVQSLACACLKLVMARVQDELTQSGYYRNVWWPLLPIHDEILSEVRADVAEEIGEYIAECFRTCVQLRVPLDAEWAQAEQWGAILK